MIFENVKAICEEKRISIHQLEVKAGLGNGTVRKWNTSAPSLENVQKVAKVLGVSITRLTRKE